MAEDEGPRMTSKDEQDVKTPSEIWPRHKEGNQMNWDPVTLARREKDIIAMRKDYPKVPPLWCEWLWDMNEKTGKVEIERIINTGEWEVPGKFSNPPSGVGTEGCDVFETEEDYLKKIKE